MYVCMYVSTIGAFQLSRPGVSARAWWNVRLRVTAKG